MDTKMLQWNIRSFQQNRLSLIHLNSILEPTVICLQETWTSDEYNFRLPGYNICSRKDRSGNGGGVAILSSSHVSVRPYLIFSNLEVCAIKLYTPSQEITIVSLYIPPTSNIANLTEELNSLVSSLPTPFIICADANGHHSSWGSPACNPRGNIINQWITSNDLVYLNDIQPTCEASNGNFTHVDITACSPNLSLQFTLDVHYDNLTSDHFPIIINSNVTLPENIQ